MVAKVIIGTKESGVLYKNAVIIKVHDDEVFYDIKFQNGKVKTYVENVSSTQFVSGNYVAVLVSGPERNRVYKIIGKGRKLGNFSEIQTVRV